MVLRRCLVLLIGVLFAGGVVASPGSGPARWLKQGALTPAASQLLDELLSADQRGLRPSDYHAAALKLRAGALDSANAAEREAFDAALSSAATQLVSDLHLGRVKPREVGYELDVKQPAFPVESAVLSLTSSANVHAELDALEPQLRHYALLKTALARYRQLAAEGPLPEGPDATRSVLIKLGDLASDETSLTEGLRRFQARHGLDPDGVLGKATKRALAMPLSVRIQQIELSMERMRWLPAQLDSPPIIVNIPQFRLFAFRTTQDNASDILQMNVIVGESFKARRTPVFAADMKYVVLNPYWDVPRSILLQELLPNIERDPEWAAKHGYEIVRGETDAAKPVPATSENIDLLRQGKLRVRQKPGPTNALGRVKFMFPNRHNVYLHDTSAPKLFLQSRRAFSHGCIRVSDPMALLAHVMRDDPTWSDERRDAALASGAPVRVPLKKPIRVFILYGTALATEAGSVLFFDDIYGQDAPLLARLAARAR